eukprot:scpid18458/ scgid27251/ 
MSESTAAPHSSESVRRRTVIVRDLPSTVTSSEVELYFQSSRSGGGDVDQVELFSGDSGQSARVVFADEDDADEVLEQQQHLIRNRSLTVERLVPKTISSAKQISTALKSTLHKKIAKLGDTQAPDLEISSLRAVNIPVHQCTRNHQVPISQSHVLLTEQQSQPETLPSGEQRAKTKAVDQQAGNEVVDASSKAREEHANDQIRTGQAGNTARIQEQPDDSSSYESVSDSSSSDKSDDPEAGGENSQPKTGQEKNGAKNIIHRGGAGEAPAAGGISTVCSGSAGANTIHVSGGAQPAALPAPSPAHTVHVQSAELLAKCSIPGAPLVFSNVAALSSPGPRSVQNTGRMGAGQEGHSAKLYPTSLAACVRTCSLQSMAENIPCAKTDNRTSSALHRRSRGTCSEEARDIAAVVPPKASHQNIVQSDKRQDTARNVATPSPTQKRQARSPLSGDGNCASGCGSSKRLFLNACSEQRANSCSASDQAFFACDEVDGTMRREDAGCGIAEAGADQIGRKVIVSCDLAKLELSSILLYYFDSRRGSGGGGVEQIEPITSNQFAVLFYECEAAKRVCLRSHTLLGTELSVTMAVPLLQPMSRRILVSCLPRECHQEIVELYFDSKKRSGGGEVVNVEMYDGSHQAIVTFESPDAVQSVTCRAHSIRDQAVTVQRERSPLQRKACLDVSGIPSEVGYDELEMYFESKKRSGGGDVSKLEYRPGTGIASIQYSTPGAADRVATRMHTLRGTSVDVSLADHRDHSLWEAAKVFDKKKILLMGVPAGISTDLVQLYLKAVLPSTDGVKVEVYPKNCRALLTFSEPIDFGKLSSCIVRTPLKDVQLTVRQVQLPCVVRLKGSLESLSISSLQLKTYLNSQSAGSANIHKRSAGVTDVEFSTSQNACDVVSRQHCIGGHSLEFSLVMAGVDYPAEGDDADSFVYLSSAPNSQQLVIAMDKEYLVLLEKCESVRGLLKSVLEDAYAIFDCVDPASLQLRILATPGGKDILGWRGLVTTNIHRFLEQLDAVCLDLPVQVYQDVVSCNLLNGTLAEFSTDTIYFYDEEQLLLTIVGVKNSAGKAYLAIRQMISTFTGMPQDQAEISLKISPQVYCFFQNVCIAQILMEDFPSVTVRLLNTEELKESVLLAGTPSEIALASNAVSMLSGKILRTPLALDHLGISTLLVSTLGQGVLDEVVQREGFELDHCLYVDPCEENQPTAQVSLLGWSDATDELVQLKSQLECLYSAMCPLAGAVFSV